MKFQRINFEILARPVLALACIAAAMVSGTDANAVTGVTGSALPTLVRHYELPADVMQARQSCFENEAVSRSVPMSGDDYQIWWNANEGTSTEQEWTAAYNACITSNPMPGGKWNFAGMTLVRVETLS